MLADKNNKCDDSPEVDTKKKCTPHSCSIDFNLWAVADVKLGNSKESTAWKFGVDLKHTWECCKQDEKLQSTAALSKRGSRKLLDGGGHKPLSEMLEDDDLHAFIEI